MSTDYADNKKSPKNKLWNLSIWKIMNQTMVRQCDVRWNQVEGSILLMYEKLIQMTNFEESAGKVQ